MVIHIQKISELYFLGALTQEAYKKEMARVKRMAEYIDREKNDDKRKILELETKLAIAYRDPLMGIFVRRVLDETSISKELPTDTTFVLCDIDNFKGINEKYGYITANKILELIGQKFLEVIKRSSDLVIRFGGDEIAIILPNCSAEKAAEKCGDIRSLIFNSAKESKFNGVSIEEPITLSFGIYHRNNDDLNVEESMDLADSAIAYAKKYEKGIDKSGITIYTPDMPVVRVKG